MITLETRLTPEVLQKITENDLKRCAETFLNEFINSQPKKKRKYSAEFNLAEYSEWLIPNCKERLNKLLSHHHFKEQATELSQAIEKCHQLRREITSDLG